MPMRFLEYFEQTLILDIAEDATEIEDTGVYQITISVEDEKNITISEPLKLQITVGELAVEVNEDTSADEEN